MLSDKSFLRTGQCGRYSQLIKEKDQPPLITPYDIQDVDGRSITEESLHRDGLDVPVVIKSSEDSRRHLGLKLPSPDTTLSDIADTLGRDYPVKVIEVGAQHEIEGYSVGEYAEYLENRTSMHKLLNMISLEVSATSLSTSIMSPRVVRQVDWIDSYWSEDRRARADFPRVQKYVLAGMSGSYTDFHVDFGGTSVWYHIIKGCKENLRAYASWIHSANQESTFFPETLSRLGECKRVEIRTGDTLMIPGAWIHAVFTPEDSLVIGGNFLLSPLIVPQLQVYGVEHRTRVNQKYRFPYFRQMIWYVLCRNLPLELKRQGKFSHNHDTDACKSSNHSVSGSDSDCSDDDDDDESCLVYPRVSWAWPYMLKMVEVWVAEGLPAQDNVVYNECGKKCLEKIGNTSSNSVSDDACIIEIIKMWWDLLCSLSRSFPEEDNEKENMYTNYDKHISKLRAYENSSKEFDVLNNDLFEYYPYVNKAEGFYTSNDDNDSLKQSALNDSTGDINIKTEKDESHISSPKADQKPTAKLSLKLNRKSQETASSTNVSTATNPKPAKIVFTLSKPESKEQSQNQINEYAQNVEQKMEKTVTNRKSVAAKKFGTRGKRLSADFLQHAADFDVSGNANSDDDNDISQDHSGSENDMDSYSDFKRSRTSDSQYLSDGIDDDDLEQEEEDAIDVAPPAKVAKTKQRTARRRDTPVNTTVAKNTRRGASSMLKERLKRKFF